MARNEHDSEERASRTKTGNVVRLRPRPWLDSEAELVPIGGRAERPGSGPESAAPRATRVESGAERTEPGPAVSVDRDDVTASPDDPGHASSWLGAGEQTVPFGPAPSARAAADFWGEDAADLHDAIEAPEPASGAHFGLRGADGGSDRISRAHRGYGMAVAALVPLRRRAVFGAGAAVLLFVIGIVAAGLASAPAASRRPRVTTGMRRASMADHDGASAHPLPSSSRSVAKALATAKGRSRPEVRAARTSRTRRARTQTRAQADGHVTSTHHQAARYLATTQSSNPAADPAPTATQTTVPAEAGASEPSSARAGPRQAFGAGGMLAVGSSPSG